MGTEGHITVATTATYKTKQKFNTSKEGSLGIMRPAFQKGDGKLYIRWLNY